MNTIGIVEATSKLAQICEHVYETKEAVLITKQGMPLVKIEPAAPPSAITSAIWKRRSLFIEQYGEFTTDFDLPLREMPLSTENPFDE